MLGEEMGESGRSARLGFGEVVEVRGGGHIVRSTSRKDRHSKVSTARGLRDRRVRLAAHTAIQFYDVQDRLGYDRPSKAVDWLITKAKAAIDELERHSALNTTAGSAPVGVGFGRGSVEDEIGEDSRGQQLERRADADLEISDVSGERATAVLRGGDEHRGLHQNQNRSASDSRARNSSLLPPSLDSDSIADTIRSFFPMDASIETSSPATQFRSLAPPDLPSRSSNHSQDLRLSLQYRDPILLHDHRTESRQQHQNSNPQHSQGQILLSGIPLGFHGTAAWPEHHHHQGAELSHFQRLPSWNSGEGVASASDGAVASAGYTFNSPPASQPLLHLLFGHEHPFFQRGPLQSSNTPAIRAWIDPLPAAGAAVISTELPQPRVLPIYPPSVSGAEFASGYGEFSGFRFPARIQGDEEEHNGYHHKPSSASSDS